jgi:hypothetical protein
MDLSSSPYSALAAGETMSVAKRAAASAMAQFISASGSSDIVALSFVSASG